MKNTALFLAITATLCSLTSCAKEETVNIDSSPIIYTEVTANEAVKADTTDISVVTENKTESTTAANITSEKADNIDDFTDLSGYWYANGNPKSAFFHITKDGRFKEYNNYYGAILYYTGYIKKEPDAETNSYAYCMYRDTGEMYNKFAGSAEKSDINFESGDVTHYVKLYDEGEKEYDEREAEETYTGTWVCGRAIIEISYEGEGVFQAKISWSSSAVAHVMWDYKLILDQGKLICSGTGKKAYVEFKTGDTKATETIEYTDGSAEFTIEGNHLFWNNFNEHDADNLLFEKNSEAY